ncbi:hypothetical protein NF27_DT00380 [Candidatus Jidaibacter acanthamoeba]|uniref:Uncharacterized protein n=1 Tax=Candidatus Jidaibacter acanthamoebae TaxID=86105 RepID=A0A0C1QIE1_9RICK|nr:hypothetical protein [Candidatus Jidaibacter acanthamoeba]KIE05264.1 hypothetical protein NF27_DT00380 [Candidatus Jidaibacter acanthamoeba]
MPKKTMSIEKRCKILKELVNTDEFKNNPLSQQYNAAMYHLIRILETRVQEDKSKDPSSKKYPNLNILRNGLVHGYFDIDKQSIVDFVNAEADNLAQNNGILLVKLRNYAIYKNNSKYSSQATNERWENLHFHFQQTNQGTIPSTTELYQAYYSDMQLQRMKVDNFLSSKYKNKEAILYCLGCFGEACNQISEPLVAKGQVDTSLGMSKHWRDKIFHAAEVDNKDFSQMIETISTYDHSSHKITLGSSKINVTQTPSVPKEDESKHISIADSQIGRSEDIGEKEAYTTKELKEIQSRTLAESKFSLSLSDTGTPQKRKVDQVTKTKTEVDKQTTTFRTSSSISSQEKAKKQKEDKQEPQQTQTGLMSFSIKPREKIKPFVFGKKDEKQDKGRG